VVICAKPGHGAPVEDCFLAAQNLMLAAHGLGLGSCPIGFARSWFNRAEVKAELGIPAHYEPVLPITLGHPAHPPPGVPRHEPETVCWHWDD
jgi:nitroreductase